MSFEKIMKPLDELIQYFYNCPIIVEPQTETPLNLIMNEIKDIGGKIKGVSFGNTLRVELSLEDLEEFDKSKNIKKLRFDGDYKLLRGVIPEQESKFDKYLIELLSFIESIPVIVQTPDGLKEEDKMEVEKLGGEIKDNLWIINSYSATLPLNRIRELAEFFRVVRIWYDQPLFGFYKVGGEIL